METALIYPDPISEHRIAFLIQEKQIHYGIARIDLSMVKMKLRDKKEGLGWTEEQCEAAEIEYKRYLHLCWKYGKGIVPNAIMDNMWHYHILDTRAYHQACNDVFGDYLHHFPYFGMRGDQDAKNLESAFTKTKELYIETFGEDMSKSSNTDCWHDCQNRCWHACSDDDDDDRK